MTKSDSFETKEILPSCDLWNNWKAARVCFKIRHWWISNNVICECGVRRCTVCSQVRLSVVNDVDDNDDVAWCPGRPISHLIPYGQAHIC